MLLVGKVLLVLVGVWLAIQALRQVDWAQVGDALGRLTWWEIVVVALIVGMVAALNRRGQGDPSFRPDDARSGE